MHFPRHFRYGSIWVRQARRFASSWSRRRHGGRSRRKQHEFCSVRWLCYSLLACVGLWSWWHGGHPPLPRELPQLTAAAGSSRGSHAPAALSAKDPPCALRLLAREPLRLLAREPGESGIEPFAPPSFPLTQLTHALEGSSGTPAVSANGARIAFRSTQDFSGGNPDGNPELFLFDTPFQTFTQLTYSTAGGSGPPVISADGTRVAFHSKQDLLGTNPDGNAEIFLFDARTHTLAQLTESTGPFGSGSFSPALSADGTRLAFHSNLDLTGENPDGTFELFLYETTTLTLSQLTSAPQGDSSAPAITADGTRIAFESYQDLTGENADGNAEIFLVDTTTQTLMQLTHSTSLAKDGSFTPSITADGSRLTFSSNQDLTGHNPDGNYEIFLMDTTAQTLTQLTETADTTNALPKITAAGTHILFEAESTIGDAFILFLVDLGTGVLTPLQHSTEAGRFQAALNASGSRLIFASAQDLTGANADGNQELFVVSAVP